MSTGAGRAGAGDNVLGMVVSTGVGGGLVLDGRLINGASGNAGHIGHVVVDPDGPPCTCGGRGCVEAIARGGASPRGRRPRAGGRASRTRPPGRSRTTPRRGTRWPAPRCAGRAGRSASRIASATNLCDLEVVAIGGGLSQAGALLFDPLEEALRAHVGMDYAKDVRVVPAELGQSAGLVGAAALLFAAGRYWSGD